VAAEVIRRVVAGIQTLVGIRDRAGTRTQVGTQALVGILVLILADLIIAMIIRKELQNGNR
jgi:hypothetical protein